MELRLTRGHGAVDRVEAPSPVDTHESEHREEEAYTDAGGALEVEGVVVLDVGETVTRFDESQRPDGGVLLEGDGVADFHGVLIIQVSHVAADRGVVRGEGARLVAAHGDVFGGVTGVTGHAVAAHIEGLEGRFGVLVEVPEVAEFGARHEDEFGVGGEGREDLARETPLVVLEEMVALGGGHLCVLRVGSTLDERVGRGDFQAQRELRTAAGVDGVVDAGARELEVEGEVMAGAVGDDEVGPVLHHVHLVTEFAIEREIVVRPTETLAVANADAESAEVLALVRLHFAVVVVVTVAAVVTVVVVVVVVVEALVALDVTVGIARLRGEEDAGTQ